MMKTLFDVHAPARFDGPFSECVARAKPADAREFERCWHRGQMRSWAGHWRRARATAAFLGKPVKEVAGTALSLAVSYRNAALKGA